MKFFFTYIYWLGAKVQYKYFGERGDNGVFLLTNIFGFIIIDIFTFFRVLFYGHVSFGGSSDFEKIIVAIFALFFYYLIGKIFQGVPIKENLNFKNVSKRKRIFHTILLYLFLIFLIYVFLVIMSPSFQPRKLKFW